MLLTCLSFLEGLFQEKIMEQKQTFTYRLGIDLGTSSIGMALYSLREGGKINKLEHLDSYIFGEPVAPKEMVTLNTARRNARLIRKQIQRKAARLKKIAYIAASLGVSAQDLRANKDDVHALRAQALEQELSLVQLVKVLSHLVKNRGYKGTLEDGTVGKKLNQTQALLQGNKTLGQLLWERKNAAQGEPWRKVEEDGTFIYRNAVEDEFERIWQTQSKYHAELNRNYTVGYENMFPDFPGQKEITLKQAFHSALFYQRPIKWELETVGACSIYPQEKRAALSQPAYQNYRLAKTLSNLRIYNKTGKEDYPLTLAQKTQVYHYVQTAYEEYSKESAKFSYAKIYALLGLGADERFTVDRGRSADDGLKGNTTAAAFYQAGVLNEWSNLDDKAQELVCEFLANITTYSDIEDNNPAYVQTKFTELTANIKAEPAQSKAALEFILQLREKHFFSKHTDFRLEQGRAPFSVPALFQITEGLLQGNEETDIIAALSKQNQTPAGGKLRSAAKILHQEAINDPVISKALTEFHRVMNYVVKKYGQPAEVVVELSREIKNSLRRRQFLEGQNRAAAKERQEAVKELQAHHIRVTGRNIEKYLLWQEQDKTCPYSGKVISMEQAFDEKQTQVDHIIPQRGEIGGPNVFENKVLAFTQENKDKSNRLPYEWKFKEDIDNYLSWQKENKAKKKKGEETLAFGKQSPLINFVSHLWSLYAKEKRGYYSQRERKQKPTQKGARILRKINNLLSTPAQVKIDFSNRQNQQTAWIGKVVLDWCKDICPKVTPSFGALTAYLRGQLHFDRILPSIRLQEGKILFDKDDKPIDGEKWKELFASPRLSWEQALALKEDFEKYCAEQPEKANTDNDRKELFESFCAEMRAGMQFNKRCDHRHHAVDAAIIGLCDLSLLQKAARHHSQYGTLHLIPGLDKDGNRDRSKDIAGLTLEDIPQYAQIKKDVQNRLYEYVVWHKPDHFPSGKLFDETAYRAVMKDGAERFVKRASLDSFLKPTPEKTVKNIELLVFGDTLKREIIRQFKERLARGLTQEEALCGRKDNPSDGIIYRGHKLKKVKYMYLIGRGLRSFDNNADKKLSSTDKMGHVHEKAYQNSGYACMDFDAKTGKRKDLIPLWKYNPGLQVPNGVIRIFIGDILYNTQDKKFYKVQRFSAQIGLFLRETTEVQPSDVGTSNIKNYKQVSSRADIGKIKEENA